MSEPNLSPAAGNTEPNAEQTRIAELERELGETRQRYAASSEEGKRLAAQNQLLAQQQQRPEIPQRQRPEDRLNEIGVDTAALTDFFNEKFQAVLTPLAQRAEAQQVGRRKMLVEYPNYNEFESKVAAFVESDPALTEQYNQTFNANPQVAMEFALLKYGEHQRRVNPAPNGQESREQQAQAQVPNTSGGGGQRGADFGPQERVQKALEAYQQNPNRFTSENYAKARFGQVITDEFLYRGRSQG